MNLKQFISIANPDKIINFLFVILLFGLPFVSYSFVLNPVKVGQELYIVSVIVLWLFFRAITFFRIKILRIHILDVCFFVFLLYCILHYRSYSYFGFLYNEFWIFSGYIMLFYLFKWSFANKKNRAGLFNFTVALIWVLCFVQSIVGLLQEFGFLKSGNEFFKVVGTFINPNFLGVNMISGLIAISYLFFFQYSENKVVKLFLIFSAFLMAYVLFLTQSRASWMALCVAVSLFYGTSEKSILFLRNNKIKALGIFSTITFMGISSLYFLYKMDTESVDGRGFIRKITLTKIVEKPILGNGIFNFAGIYNDTKAHYFLDAKRSWEEIKVGDYVAFVFNDYLQIIFEIGFIGLLLIALILFFILKDITLNPKTRLGLALIVSFCFLAIFTSVLYNPNAMIYAIWALSILVVFGKEQIPMIESNDQFFIKGFALFLIAINCVIGTIYYKKTVGLSSFKTVIISDKQKIHNKLRNNVLFYIQEDPYVEFQTGYEKYQTGNSKKGLEMMENSVKKNPIPKANIALADLYLQQQNFHRTEQLLKMNIGIEPSRFEPRNNLLQFYINMNQKEKSIKVAQEIIHLPVKKASMEVTVYKEMAQSILKASK